MAKMISTTEASADLETVLTWVEQNRGEVILEQDGTPRAALISIAEYEELAARREQARQERIAALLAWAEEARRTMPPSRSAPELTAEERQELLAQLQRLREQVSARNQDMTEEEIEAFADQVTREAIQSLIDRGELRFAS
jgi:prevent-host-death family protein